MKTGMNKLFSSNFGLIAGLFAIAVALTGCGNDNGSGGPSQPGNPGVPGYGGGVTGPIGGGAYRVSFIGSDIYSSPIKLMGGPVAQNGGSSTCAYARCYCGSFAGGANGGGFNQGWFTGMQNYAMITSCWLFKNFEVSGWSPAGQYISSNDTGSVNIGGAGMVGGTNIFEGTSLVEPGLTIRMVQTAVTRQDGSHINVSGEIILPATFMQRNFGSNISPNFNFIGAAIDLNPTATQGGRATVNGGVLLYTGGNAQTNFTGVFLSI